MHEGEPTVASLEGIDALPVLETLGIYGNRNLHDLAPLRYCDATRTLRMMEFDACPTVSRLDDICSATGLRWLSIAECRDIESLAPISALTELESLHAYGSTRIVDGDLTPLLRLQRLGDVSLMSRPHYRPSAADVFTARGLSHPTRLR